jgi:hypothetical protein
MTTDTDTDPIHAFTQALPTHARHTRHLNQTLHAAIHAALRDGWTPQQLAHECARDLTSVVNAGAVITHRLRHAANNPPSTRASSLTVTPLCGHCDNGWTLNPVTLLPESRCPCRTTPAEAHT